MCRGKRSRQTQKDRTSAVYYDEYPKGPRVLSAAPGCGCSADPLRPERFDQESPRRGAPGIDERWGLGDSAWSVSRFFEMSAQLTARVGFPIEQERRPDGLEWELNFCVDAVSPTCIRRSRSLQIALKTEGLGSASGLLFQRLRTCLDRLVLQRA